MVREEDENGTIRFRAYVVKFNPEAQHVWKKFTDDHAAEVNDECFPESLSEPWSKMKGYCARLALVVHYLRWAVGEVAGDKADVDGEDVRRAVRLINYFKSTVKKVHAVVDVEPIIKDARRVIRWLSREIEKERCKRLEYPEFLNETLEIIRTQAEIHTGVFGGKTNVEDVEKVLHMLVKLNYIRQVEVDRSGPGAPKKSPYKLNIKMVSVL
jgi:hypothetical protein